MRQAQRRGHAEQRRADGVSGARPGHVDQAAQRRPGDDGALQPGRAEGQGPRQQRGRHQQRRQRLLRRHLEGAHGAQHHRHRQQQPAAGEAAVAARPQQQRHRHLRRQAQRDDAGAVVAVDHVAGQQRQRQRRQRTAAARPGPGPRPSRSGRTSARPRPPSASGWPPRPPGARTTAARSRGGRTATSPPACRGAHRVCGGRAMPRRAMASRTRPGWSLMRPSTPQAMRRSICAGSFTVHGITFRPSACASASSASVSSP